MLAAEPHPKEPSAAERLPVPSSQLETIFQEYHGKVFSAAYRVTGNAHDAEDVLQTVFMRLLRRQDRLDLSPSPGAYLHRSAVNAALDQMRARARSRSVPLDELTVLPEDENIADPERQHNDRELRRGLRQAILSLSEKAAEIFTLRFLEDVPNQDIAEQLGMSQNAVGVALHRARTQVKKEIRSFVGES